MFTIPLGTWIDSIVSPTATVGNRVDMDLKPTLETGFVQFNKINEQNDEKLTGS